MRILLIMLVALSLVSCVVYDTWDRCESMRKGEIRWVFPADEIAREIKVKREHLPSKCQKYYNNGSEDWINCMGVGYKTSTDGEM